MRQRRIAKPGDGAWGESFAAAKGLGLASYFFLVIKSVLRLGGNPAIPVAVHPRSEALAVGRNR